MKYPDIIDEMYKEVSILRDSKHLPYDCPRYWAYSFLMFCFIMKVKVRKCM